MLMAQEQPYGHEYQGPVQQASAEQYAAEGSSSAMDWVSLVTRIRDGDPEGMEDLYRLFSGGIRYYLCRQLGAQELDDKVHDTFLIVVHAIRRGDLREPERLMGFVRTVVRRQVAAYIDRAVHDRKEQVNLESGVPLADLRRTPEECAIDAQRAELMEQILQAIPRRDREILTRFYLREQTQEEICEEMKLTETQFRLLKSRAKSRFGALGRRRLMRKPMASIYLRRMAAAAH